MAGAGKARGQDTESDVSMYRLLADLRIVESAAFVAAPLCALHMAQLGAEVIRIDAIGGGPDFLRWPRAPAWERARPSGLNRRAGAAGGGLPTG